VASERDTKVFFENQSIGGSFGIFLTPLVRLKSVKQEMPGNFKVRFEGIL
jgi:hypothetical protein